MDVGEGRAEEVVFGVAEGRVSFLVPGVKLYGAVRIALGEA